jgi:hypothetical protein
MKAAANVFVHGTFSWLHRLTIRKPRCMGAI